MSYQYELRHWRYFLAVAEELHFRRAADRLYISQPGLSRQIKELEEGIGVLLFERGNKHVKLTKAGQFLQEEMKRLFHGFEHVIEHAKLLSDGLLGNLRVGYVGSAMQQVIPDLLIELKTNYPNVIFNLKEMEVEQQIDALNAHDLDIGFVRMGTALPRGLEMYAVLEEPFCLVLPSEHKVSATNFEGLSQFKEEPFILFDPNYSPSYHQKIMQIFNDSGFDPIVTHNTIQASSIYKLVEHGLGLSIIPRSLATSHIDTIKFIELNQIRQRTTLSAVWNSENKNPILDYVLKMLYQK